MQSFNVPRWYQELSIPQMKQILALADSLICDYKEQVPERTQKILANVGITSTFIKVSSKKLRHFQKSFHSDPAKFLCEIYRYVTGYYFEDEGYKKFYNCNERLLLTSIAFLKLPETIIELHRRLPVRKDVKIPPKPLPEKAIVRTSGKSPYLEMLFKQPDWNTYRMELEKWREKRRFIFKPQIILPPVHLLAKSQDNSEIAQSEFHFKTKRKKKFKKKKKSHFNKISDQHKLVDGKTSIDNYEEYEKIMEENGEIGEDMNFYEHENKELKDEGERDDLHREKYKEENDKNSKETKLDISKDKHFMDEIDVEQESISCGEERIFCTKKYPIGKQYLSSKWQQRLDAIDYEYEKLEKVANCLLNNVRQVSKKIYNPDICDNCCACRETRKYRFKKKFSKTPYSRIDGIIIDNEDKEQLRHTNSIIMHSPPESLSGSLTKLYQEIPSREEIIKKRIVNEIIVDENRNIKFNIISGVVKDTLYIQRKKIYIGPPVRNVPPCACNPHHSNEESIDFEENKDEVDKIGCLENEKCIAGEVNNSSEFSYCKKCCSDDPRNKIFRDFEVACKKRDQKQKEKQAAKSKKINHETCTQRFYPIKENNQDDKNDIKSEICKGCCEFTEKCKSNPFKNILKAIEEQKMEHTTRVSKKSEIKQYKEKIKFVVNGVVQNYDDVDMIDKNDNIDDNKNDINEHLKMTYMLSEVTIHTPITITPISSESDLSQISLKENHHHWSITQFTPKPKLPETNAKPLVKPRTRFNLENLRKIIDEPFSPEIEDFFQKVRELKLLLRMHDNNDSKDVRKEDVEDDLGQHKVKKNVHKKAKKIKYIKSKYGKIKLKDEKKKLEDSEIEKDLEVNKTDGEILTHDKNEDNFKNKSLKYLMKIALKKMAEEGFLLAKLPDCHKIPQLQTWIMLREGFILTEKKKNKLLENSRKIWDIATLKAPKKVSAPVLTPMKHKEKEKWTDDDFKKFQAEVKLKKKIYESKVCNFRVQLSRDMWNSMEFIRFPNLAFKRAYFTYQPCKEAEGYLYRP